VLVSKVKVSSMVASKSMAGEINQVSKGFSAVA